MSFPLDLFPPNGLDRSLHTAVLIGLAIGTFFTETLGWTYAGLVVPGYLATVFYAAPVTAAFIVLESIATYLLVALLGRWITRTGSWSTAFGRERFYLFIVGAVLVRLALEGSAVPRLATRYGLAHSRELYSVGLVLVPLVANAFWNSGLKKAGPRLALVTALTAIALGALLRTTNLSVSRFQVLNESLSLEFLESPKAHLILVIGALLGARNNVLYGWDYNGILVPALLAVAWYEPTKLLTTTAEALFIYYTTRLLISVRPFSRMLLVGPRRMLFVYVAGYLLKLIIGFGAARWAPGLQMIDYFGFGYLLPSLLAVKMWNKEHVGVVIMPTVQVSLTAFLIGNGVGYAIAALGGGGARAAGPGMSADPGQGEAALARPAPRQPTGSAMFSLLLADTAPRPGPIPGPEAAAADAEARWIAHRIAREVIERGAPSEESRRHAELAAVAVVQESAEGGRPWFVLSGWLHDADHAPATPRAAFRARPSVATPAGPAWLVVAAPAPAGSPLPLVALQAADTLDAVGVVMLSRHEAVRRHDEAFVAAMVDHLEQARVLVVEVRSDDARPSLSVVGSAAGLPVIALGKALGEEVALTFREAASATGLSAGVGRGSVLAGSSDAARLRVPLRVAEAAGAALLGAPAPLEWPGRLADELTARMFELTSVEPGEHRSSTLEELRLFDAVVAPRLIRGGARGFTAWERAVMGRLGFRAVTIGGGEADAAAQMEAWGIVEPGPGDPAAAGEPLPPRRGNPTWLVLRASTGEEAHGASKPPGGGETPAGPAREAPLLVEVPAPRWQIGAFGAGLAIARAAGADAMLIAGALPTADPSGAADVRRREGLRTYFQRGHELWIGGAGDALSIQAIEADRSLGRDMVISFGRELVRSEQVPAFAGPLLETLRDLDLRVSVFDGTREQVSFSGAMDAGMTYAKRFAEGRFAIVFLGSAVRELFELRRAYGPASAWADAPAAAAGEGERLMKRLARLGVDAPAVDVAERAAHLAACAAEPAPPARGARGAGRGAASAQSGAGDPACPSRRARPDCDLDASLEGFRRYAAERNPFDLKAQAERGRGGCHVEIRRDEGSGQPWAIAARPGEAMILPLDGALVPVASRPLPAPERVRRAVAIGTSAVRVVARGGAAP